MSLLNHCNKMIYPALGAVVAHAAYTAAAPALAVSALAGTALYLVAQAIDTLVISKIFAPMNAAAKEPSHQLLAWLVNKAFAVGAGLCVIKVASLAFANAATTSPMFSAAVALAKVWAVAWSSVPAFLLVSAITSCSIVIVKSAAYLPTNGATPQETHTQKA